MYGIYTMCSSACYGIHIAENSERNCCASFAQVFSKNGPLTFKSVEEAEAFVETMELTADVAVSIMPTGYFSPTHTAH